MKISEIRKEYPQYNSLSDKELADALHNKFYPDMPLGDFYERVGLAKPGAGGLSDIATAFKQGAVGSTKALTDIFGAENVASTTLDKTSEALQKDYSAARQAELQAQAARMKQAEQSGSIWEEIKAGAQNIAEAPLQAAAQGVGSFVPYLPTMFIGPIAGALRLAKPTIVALEGLAGTAQKLIGTAQGAGAVKGSIYDAVYDKEIEAGVEPEIAKRKAVAAQEYLGKNWEQIAVGGTLGRVAAGSGVEQLLTKKGAQEAADKLGQRVGSAVLKEGLTEAPQGGQERLAANLALQREGYDTPLFQGVAGAATQEGLTGGLSAAPIAAIRGPKAEVKPQQQQQEEFAKLRAEEEQRLEAERQRKATPEYAQEVVQKYDALAKQKQDLIAQIKKIEKGSPTADADRAFNRDINAQIKALSKEIEPLADDYYKSKAMLGQMAEQERVAKLTPQEYAFGLEPETDEQKKAQEQAQGPEYYEQQIAMPAKPAAELTPRQKIAEYADQRIALANDQQNTAASFAPKYKAETLKDYTDYLMQDPELAQQVVENRTPLTGLPKGLSNAEVLDALKLQVKPLIEAKKKAETQKFETEMGVRKEALGATKKVEEEDQSVAALRDWMDESKGKFLPVTDNDFNYLNGMFEKAFDTKPVIAVNPEVKTIARGPQVRERIDALIDEADKADQAYRTARYAIPAQGKRGAPERAAAMEALTKGKVALEKLEQLSKSGGAYAREVIAARRKQQEAMAKLSDITEQLRTGQTLGKETEQVRNPKTGEMETQLVGFGKGVAASSEQSLINKASQIRGQLVSSALQEAALHRRAAGNPAISQDEALKAASAMYDAVNDWVARSNAKPTRPEFEEVIVQPAQMRADKIVRPAVTERREVKAGTQAISPAEIAHFQERIKSAMRNLYEKPEVKTTRVETGPLKRQFAAEEAKKTAEAKGETATTLRGELARRKEYTTNLIDKALARKNVPENIRDGLERAKNMIEDGVADKRLLDAAENQAERVLRGQDLGQVTRMGREQVDAGKQVVRNVPGKEASTEIGRRGQKFVTTGTQEKAAPEKAAFPKGKSVAVEANEALRELEEAMSFNKRVAQEEAGQKTLFPEAQEDLGYIRATPANFAKSPRIKPVWAAIDHARAVFKKTEPVRLAKEATRKNRLKLLNQLEERMDSIRKDTQFFWKDTSRWSDAELAKVFVGMPEAGTTQADKDILYKYVKGQPLTAQEKVVAARLINDFQTQELPKYQEKIKEAMQLLAQGRRLADADNQLLSFMQDTNANVRAAAKALNERMAGMRDTVKYLKEVMRGSAILTPEQKAMLDSEKAVEDQRGAYQRAVEQAITKAGKDMEAARTALLDPQIMAVSKELEEAKNILAKEKPLLEAEIARYESHLNAVLVLHEGAMRDKLARAKRRDIKEKKYILEDLTDKVKEQEKALDDLVTERHEEFDGATVVIQAMLDGNVKFERQFLEMQEANLAAMRGESVLDKPNAYPFAYRQAEKNLQVQKQTVKAAEKRATEFKEIAKSDQQKMEDFWKDKLGGEGIKREEGRVERIQTTAEKEAEKLRREAIEALDKQADAAEREALKEQILKTYADQMGDLLLEVEAIPGPNTEAELKKIINDPKSELDDVINAQAKVGALQAIASVEAQEEVFLEGTPKKKQRAATTLSSIGQAKGKPLRTGRMTDAKLEKLFKPTAKEKALESIYFEEADQGGAGFDQYGEGKTQGSFDFGGDFNFSRGESTTGTDAKTLKAELDEAMGGDVTERGNVHIYNSVEEFLKENPDYRGEIPLDAKGFAEEGSATLFANNIGKGHGLGVLLHEVGVHIGFRNFFNQAQFSRLVSTVKGWAARTDNSLEAQIGRKAMQRVEMAETSDTQVDDELLAYAVEEAVQAGVLETRKGPLFGWLSSIIDAFKKALNKLGFPTSEITAGDLVNFAYGCAQLELRGTWHGTGATFDQFDFSFMGTGEGVQAYSWGSYRAQRHGIANSYRTAEVSKLHMAAMEEWENLPEVKAWEKSQRPTFEGHTSDDFYEFSRNAANRDDMLGTVPAKYANRMASSLKLLQQRVSEGTSFSPASTITAYLKAAGPAFKLEQDQKAYDNFVAGLDLAELKTPYAESLYKGKTWTDLYFAERGSEEHTAGEVLYEAKSIEGDTFKERLDAAFTKLEKEKESRVRIFANSDKYIKEHTEAVNTLAQLKKLNKNNFVFEAPTASPIPEPVSPTGSMMRVIHLHPDNTYLMWDALADKQPEPVDKAVRELFNDLSEEAQIKFLSLLPDSKPAKGKDIYNALSNVIGGDRPASLAMYKYGISGNKFLDGMSRTDRIDRKSTFNYVDFADKEQGAQIVATNIDRVGKAKGVLLSRKPQYSNTDFANVGDVISRVVAQDKSWTESIKANLTGLAFETQLVDRFAGFERLAKYMEPLKGTQMLYYLRTYDQRMNMVSQSVSNGAPEIVEKKRADGQIERIVESTNGASLAGIVNTLKDAKQYIGNGEAVNQAFTTYMAAIRAANKGIETLNFGTDKDGKPVLTQAMLDKVTNLVNSNPALKKVFEDARKEYNEYNRDMLNFVANTGALSKELVKRLVAQDDYIPFYRERKGVVELVIGNESPIRIGSIAEQPYLDKLVGGDTAILDFMTSSVQNTNMLMDMGLRNLATKNAVMELVDLKAATLVKKADGPDVVKFKVDGDDRYAIIATEKVKIGNKEFETGVPADILVKGMEGIPTQMPFLLRVMSMPAQILRKSVTLSPLYMAKQLFRDSLAAPILSGADFTPVYSALKEINSATKQTLERRGITGGQQFKGTSEDLSKILRDISEGQPGWMQALGKFEAMGMEADALTRRAQYNSYIEQGLSEMEATLMSLESMNFNKRGASPSVHVANALIPFFNAQIQGLNVLYKAMFGKMPFNDQLRIREKMLMRGGMMAAATLLYAVMMEDDEAYKNATPDQKYGNWFVRLPGLDEPIKIPVPFEIGYIFKSIPEALYNIMTTEHGGEEAVKAFKQILLQTVPGGSSYGIPQAVKPLIEVGLGKSFYTGRDILSEREKQLLPEEQYRANTSDAAKALGSGLGISPIKIEALVSGYTGTMGLAFMQAISIGVPAKETPEQAVKRLSEYPIVGGVFQPNDAGGIVNSVYERMNEALKVKATVNKLLEEGKVPEAQALMTKRGTEYMQAELANTFKTNMTMLTQAERAIASSTMTPEAKREQLDKIRKMKIGLANATREISDKTIRLVGGS